MPEPHPNFFLLQLLKTQIASNSAKARVRRYLVYREDRSRNCLFQFLKQAVDLFCLFVIVIAGAGKHSVQLALHLSSFQFVPINVIGWVNGFILLGLREFADLLVELYDSSDD
jgi:hypothetical protein